MERSLDELMRRYKDEIMRYAGRQSVARPANAQMQNNMSNRQINNVTRSGNPIIRQQNNMAMNRPMMQPQSANNNSNLTVLPALNGNNDTGYMIVQVSALQGAVPIANADVVVTRDIGNETYLMWYDVTDESGKSRKFELPAPPREMSEQPSNGSAPYSTYNVRVSAPGFYTVTNAGAQVFGGQTSIAAIDMIPKRESQMGTEENITYNTPPNQLLNS